MQSTCQYYIKNGCTKQWEEKTHWGYNIISMRIYVCYQYFSQEYAQSSILDKVIRYWWIDTFLMRTFLRTTQHIILVKITQCIWGIELRQHWCVVLSKLEDMSMYCLWHWHTCIFCKAFILCLQGPAISLYSTWFPTVSIFCQKAK